MDIKYWYVVNKGRVRDFLKRSNIIKFILNLDITFIFLFLALKLFGYDWNLANLIGSFGLWLVFEEVIKKIRILFNK